MVPVLLLRTSYSCSFTSRITLQPGVISAAHISAAPPRPKQESAHSTSSTLMIVISSADTPSWSASKDRACSTAAGGSSVPHADKARITNTRYIAFLKILFVDIFIFSFFLLCREFHQFWWLMERICVVHHFTHRRWRTKKVPFYYGFLKNQSWGRVGNDTAVGISRLVRVSLHSLAFLLCLTSLLRVGCHLPLCSTVMTTFPFLCPCSTYR